MLLKQIKNYFILITLVVIFFVSLFTGLADLLSKDFLPGILFFVVAFMCFPQIREYIKHIQEIENYNPNTYIIYLTILILLFCGFYFRKGKTALNKNEKPLTKEERKQKYIDSLIYEQKKKDIENNKINTTTYSSPEEYYATISPDEVRNLSNESKVGYRQYIINSTLDKYNKLDDIQQEMVIIQICINIYGDKWYNDFDSDKRESIVQAIYKCIKPSAEDPQLAYTVKLKDIVAGCMVLMRLDN